LFIALFIGLNTLYLLLSSNTIADARANYKRFTPMNMALFFDVGTSFHIFAHL